MESRQSKGEGDWDNIRFGSRSTRPAAESAEDRAQSRFVVGIAIFLAVAFAYPWYSYWVNLRITTYGLEVAVEHLGRETERAENESLDGEEVRVQKHRGNAPALDAGRMRC